ncbi:MAG: hypothetical protein QOE09_3669 [Ilumatobacteraceae bacterium]
MKRVRRVGTTLALRDTQHRVEVRDHGTRGTAGVPARDVLIPAEQIGQYALVRESRLRLLFGSFLLWTLFTIAVVGQTALDYYKVGSYDESCPIGDSGGGPSHWQWWLPHGVCDYPRTGHRSEGVLEGLRVLVPLCWLVFFVVVAIGLTSHIREQLREPAPTGGPST